MNFVQRFTFLFSAPTFDSEDLEGLRVQQIIAAIQRLGFQVVRAPRIEDAEIAVQTDAAVGCLVVDWGKKGLEGKTASLINLMRRRGLEMPIVLLVRRRRFEDVPMEVLDFIDGYVFLAEETPEFIARNLVSRLTQYAETLKTPRPLRCTLYFRDGSSTSFRACVCHFRFDPISRHFVAAQYLSRRANNRHTATRNAT
jgi:ornithine decarboxylase